MRQLPLNIGQPPQHRLDNFVVGHNAGTVSAIEALLAQADVEGGWASPVPVYLWGEPGSGKTHLLGALAEAVGQRGAQAAWFNPRAPRPWTLSADTRLAVLDDCQLLDADQQHAAFSVFIEAAAQGVLVASAGAVPPVDLPLRDDLRSRLGWGLVCQVHPLAESERRAVLRREADRRGLLLGDEVMDFLLHRHARDLGTLMGWLDRLDQFALASKRSITIPLIRDMLAQEDLTRA